MASRKKRKSSLPEDSAEPVVVSLLSEDDDDEASAGGANVPSQAKRRSRRISSLQEHADNELMLTFHADESGTGRGSRDVFNILWGDFRRLRLPDGKCGAEQLLLNDTLVDWYLKGYLEARLMSANPRLRERTHIFSSFFLKKLPNALQHRGEHIAKLLKWVQVRLAPADASYAPSRQHSAHYLHPPPPFRVRTILTRGPFPRVNPKRLL